MDNLGFLLPFFLIAVVILFIVSIAAIFKVFNIANLLQEIRNDLKKLVPPDSAQEDFADDPEEFTPSQR
jgi:hypothetical protein